MAAMSEFPAKRNHAQFPHFVRSARYGERLLTIAEFRQREELAAMVRSLPRMGYLVRVQCAGLHLRNRLRIEFGTDDARSIPLPLLDAAYVLLIELTAKARAYPDNSYEGLKAFSRDVLGAGHKFPHYGRRKRAAKWSLDS